ncbi:trans-aconitate 2-methyltransferase [Stenotrophomonas sp. 24(2023)]|uniref:trans-aconitate 2-methyltransferase n=1 Tax=Stenotrophomonas sp. 24(2023) TaxID=3068324 RepID=UPI0027DF06C8|nr:trans-aconitate 2-methyltransferase [Stenotrophomonas sp. 24(2023)]WMJ70853.1 trans-aconitate 2-methyltransferase [Stenotrophomonas sp. 24(2023)]
MTWSATQYRRFEDERTRPVRDLVAAIPLATAATAVDLGCGPGNSTEVLAARYPQARVSGLDSSQDMIDSARQRLPQLHFDVADIAQWQADAPVDVILANAALQWLPDHAALYPHLLAQLADGGCLAIQTPDNLDEPAHRIAREVATSGPWRAAIGHVAHPDRHPAAWYYALLKPHCQHLEVWRTTYLHPLAGGHDAIVEWFKGSALRPYLALLDAPQQAAFLAEYRRGIAQAYALLDDGSALLPFPRLFIVATR